MPRRKIQAQAIRSDMSRKSLLNANAYGSLIYGVVAVFVLFLIVIFGFRILSTTDKGVVTEQPETDISESVPNVISQTSSIYVVKDGDTLWSISERYYKTGYEWKRIADANKLGNPSVIFSGTKLSIPSLPRGTTSVVSQTQTSTLGASNEKIEGKVYTVQKGDNLWDISVRAYGDGYKWGEIARVNKLNNPDLIHSGNKFVIPR